MYSGRGRFNNRKNNFNKFQKRPQQQKKEYRHQDQLTEPEVGITEYISKLEGFTGIIKARYSDFHVNEIDSEGNIAKLTNTGAPKDFVSKISEEPDYKTIQNSPIEQLPQGIWEGIKNLVTSEKAEPVNLDCENLSKDDRTKVHQCIKSYFRQKVVAHTFVTEDKKYIQFKKFNKEAKADVRFQWPEDKGEYVYFLVYKEALDTMDACLKISDCLNISPANFTYAGVKDRRAKTTQWFCVKKVEPWKLMKKTRPLRNIKLGNYTFKHEPLKLGLLQGNKFRIALRNITADNELLNKSMEYVKEHGFINYYGLQRFGNDKEVPTYDIGISLLLGKWKEAVQLILKPKASDDSSQDVAKAKKIFSETGDAAKAHEILDKNKNKCVEARLLESLKKVNENDYVNALENIPRNMRLLYIHSFQSLIWNKMVSKRLQLFGMDPVEGDFVLIEKNDTSQEECEEKSEEGLSTENKEEHEEIPEENPEDINEKEEEAELKCKQEVKALTADDLPNYTIYDIVLPLPGYNVKYPENLQQHYKEALEEYGLTLEMTKQRVKTYTLCGDYRKILERANNMSWKIMHYNNPTDTLIRSDFEELRGDREPKDIKDGKYKALIMELNLPSSCYATMILREILKTDTSSSAHALLNDYFKTGENKKIIINHSEENDSKQAETCDANKSGSLLSDPEKYEEFKSSIFKAIECPVKRKSEREEEESEGGKKIKTEESAEQGGIKMEASLV